jgi:hypothetical protein
MFISMVLSSQNSLEMKLENNPEMFKAIKENNGILKDQYTKNKIFFRHGIKNEDRKYYAIYQFKSGTHIDTNKYFLTNMDYVWIYTQHFINNPNLNTLRQECFENYEDNSCGFPIHVISTYPIYLYNKDNNVKVWVNNIEYDSEQGIHRTRITWDLVEYKNDAFQIHVFGRNDEPSPCITFGDVFPGFRNFAIAQTKTSLFYLKYHPNKTLQYSTNK